MQKQRLVTAVLIAVYLSLATAVLALAHVRAQRNELSAKQIDTTCETPDSPGCAALLNQIEPGA